MYCKYCGKEIESNSAFCPYCGKKLENRNNDNGFYVPLNDVKQNNYNKKKRKKFDFKIILVIVACIFVVGAFFLGSGSETENTVATIDNQVIYDNNDVVITAKGLENEGNHYYLKILIENNSNISYNFCVHSLGVNDIIVDDNIYNMATDVASKKKANTKLELDSDVLSEYEINQIKCIDMLIWAYNNDTNMKEFDTDQIEIKTNLYEDLNDYIDGENVYNNDGIKIDYISTSDNVIRVAITNASGEYISYSIKDVNINGYTANDTDIGIFNETLLNNCQDVVEIELTNDFMAENNIDKFTSLELKVEIKEKGNYEKERTIGPIKYTIK